MYRLKNYKERPIYIKEMQDFILKIYNTGKSLSSTQITIGDKIIENWKLDCKENQDFLLKAFYDNDLIDLSLNLVNKDPNYMNVSSYISSFKKEQENKIISINDILRDLGYADSTIKTTIKKFSNKSLSSEDDAINILTQVAKSTSKFKKIAKEYLKNVFNIEVIK